MEYLMSRQPAPTDNEWAEMKHLGKEIAEMARSSKKYGHSVNLKGKIVSYLRLALKLGIQRQVDESGTAFDAEKAAVTAWANFQAGEVMRRTSEMRRSNQMSDFGYAVANAQKDAFKKGWSLAAGRTTLAGTGDAPARTSSEALAKVPSKYHGAFGWFAFYERRHPGEHYVAERFPGVWMHCRNTPEGLKPFEENASAASVAALLKAGLLEELEAGSPDGLTIRLVRLNEEGKRIAEEHDRLHAVEIEANRVRLRKLGMIDGNGNFAARPWRP
ncbi:hypothetical protein [Paracoccus sp. ME4]|uniref:hypothetical protein n=1 Tax=Paracoccus sp. ME4 TaxID=3138066 RepID=UPI00398BB87A